MDTQATTSIAVDGHRCQLGPTAINPRIKHVASSAIIGAATTHVVRVMWEAW